MDFRAAALPPPAAHMPALFSQPPALPPPPPPSQAGLFLYPGLSSPVKPPSHLLPPHKVSPRNTATVPPLPQSLAPVTSVGQPPVSAASSQANSFAAALKSLARNAGGTETKEPAAPSKSSRDSAPPMSPKRGPLHVPRAPHTDNPPPVVAIAPTPTHQRSRITRC
ncbi:proline-rich receptor-like protein kinase PERK2 [Amphibalanus amphitrite]|uniref:proline-rich receptor-like protein kinase PERK2 n=1 Tax=Amphibalanus amphitrite TaxID=1232801 RepID=UPI001C9037C1|nr:proline-rich receptor-like protein kinase PERK2 [Amphibalanus amphitrite]